MFKVGDRVRMTSTGAPIREYVNATGTVKLIDTTYAGKDQLINVKFDDSDLTNGFYFASRFEPLYKEPQEFRYVDSKGNAWPGDEELCRRAAAAWGGSVEALISTWTKVDNDGTS